MHLEEQSSWRSFFLHASPLKILLMLALATIPLIACFLSYPRCQEIGIKRSSACRKRNLMFAKTHKCGTSTLVNTFYLVGVRRRLNFVVQYKQNKKNITSFHEIKLQGERLLHVFAYICTCICLYFCRAPIPCGLGQEPI